MEVFWIVLLALAFILIVSVVRHKPDPEKVRIREERLLRATAERKGLWLRKSRRRKKDSLDYGLYSLYDQETDEHVTVRSNWPSEYQLTLQDVKAALTGKQLMKRSTEKQIVFALKLMADSGYGIDEMGEDHARLGATKEESKGRVVEWLINMDRERISQLIEDLLPSDAHESG